MAHLETALPLRQQIAAAAPDIAEAEQLLDDAEASGLRFLHFSWIALREVRIVIAEEHTTAWLIYLGKQGFHVGTASFNATSGSVCAHIRHADGRRVDLVMKQTEQAPRMNVLRCLHARRDTLVLIVAIACGLVAASLDIPIPPAVIATFLR